MVTVDEIGKVRRAYWVQGKKIKAIARETGLSRGTVRRIVRSGETVLTYERREQPLPKLGPFVEQLNKLLEANMARRKRDRLTTKRLTEQLREVGYAGGYDAGATVCATLAPGACGGERGGVCAAHLSSRRVLSVRLEPRDCHPGRGDDG